MNTRRGDQGLSLLETVIAIALLSMVMLVLYGLIGVGIRGWVSLIGQADVQQHPRIAAGRVLAEVRQSKDFVIGTGGASLGLVKVTQLTADAVAGAASFPVEDASALAAGWPVVLLSLNSHETLTASSIAGTTVSVAPTLGRAHRLGEAVRRGQTSLSAAAAPGSTLVTVASATALAAGDAVAVGGEGPFTITGIAGNFVSVTPALSQAHQAGEVVQPLAVVFQLTGPQLLRNGVVLADLLAAPPGRSFFSAASTALAVAAAPGATGLCVQSVAGFAVNDRVQIDRESYGIDQAVLPDRATVVGVDALTNCLTVDRGLTVARAVGAVVRVLAVEVNILGTQFNQAIGQTQEVAVTSRAAVRN